MAGGASVLGAGRALLGARRRSFTHGTRGARRASRRSDAAAAPGAVALFGGLEKMLKGDPATKTRERYQPRVDAVNKLAPSVAAFTDDELRAATAEFQKRAQSGESLDALLPEAFAVVREASERVLGLRPFDTQLIGGMILHEGEIAEMRTGEGKTLVAVLPAYLNALAGKGVHVVTVNDYLARRDCEWVGQVHRFLGLKVGLIQQNMSEEDRRAAYAADVTYVTNSELGFDYLRDNLAQSASELVLRDFNYCVIDEVDSILIDEARTPLIISGPADKPSARYVTAAKIAAAFNRDVHYTVDEKGKSVLLTEEGYEAAEDLLQVTDLYDPREQWALYLINALKAKELQLKDVNYIVRGNEIVIVDEFTGRTMTGRRWSDGLHQAVEAKEGVEIQDETITIASVTYQSFFRNYEKLAGMTGTAATELTEFNTIYNLSVQVVPTNRAVQREDSQDVVFRAESGKWNAVRTEIKRMHRMGRPTLVGTTSVERSEAIAELLEAEGIPYELLNAKPENVEREAEIVAQSGRRGAVTISTNMAGRGTDILLGGNAEFMARLKIREVLLPRVALKEDGEIAFEKKGNKAAAKRANKWAVDSKLYPCELSDAAKAAVAKAVDDAVADWGEFSLPGLDAEDRLSVACEKAPTTDPTTQSLRDAFIQVYEEYKVVTDAEKDDVIQLGGLHVIGTERHESRRVDNQLRGRSGRQGDPGSTRYFLSLEDNLFRIFGGDRIDAMMDMFRVDDLPIESGMLTKSLDEAQKKVETYFYDIRKQLFDYDQVLNQQREKLYFERRRALLASREELQEQMKEYAELTMEDICGANLDVSEAPETWDFDSLAAKVQQYCYLLTDVTPEVLKDKATEGGFEGVQEFLKRRGVEAYVEKCNAVEEAQAGLMMDAERYFVLTQTDNLWKQHLQAIKFIQQAVGLRGYAQKDPLIEYKLEGYNLFVEMLAQIRRNVIYSVYSFQVKKETVEVAVDQAEGEGESEAVVAGAGAGGKGRRGKKGSRR